LPNNGRFTRSCSFSSHRFFDVSQKALPRLLYLADTPVEATYHGSALIYRLLQEYPRDQLLVLQPSLAKGQHHRRIASALYIDFPFGSYRLLHSRFAAYYRSWLILTAPFAVSKLRRAIADFRPDAIVTVTHGFSWIAAAAVAQREKLPLYVIVHDDWPRITHAGVLSRKHLDRRFAFILRQAATTFCVSPAMQETYQNRYSARTSLLYPSRSKDSYSQVAPNTAQSDSRLTVAFAGTVNSDGYARLLRLVAHSLVAFSGRLLLFGPHTARSLEQWKLNFETIENRGLVDAEEIRAVLQREANVLLVPMSFVPEEKENMRLGFPSKIAEYSATGLPMLIFGPEYCSAVQWAQGYESVAEVVTSDTPNAIGAALNRLAAPRYRAELGRRSAEIGERLFSHATAQKIFYSALDNTDQAMRGSRALKIAG
jgi:hypothetical protein